MPKTWLYFIVLFLPLALRVLVLNTDFVEWLWYNQYVDYFNILNGLRVQPAFLEFVGGWALPVFVVTVCCYWIGDEDERDLGSQFLLLPIFYVPFAMAAHVLAKWEFEPQMLYAYPLILIPCGYLYVLPFALCIRVFDKLRIVL